MNYKIAVLTLFIYSYAHATEEVTIPSIPGIPSIYQGYAIICTKNMPQEKCHSNTQTNLMNQSNDSDKKSALQESLQKKSSDAGKDLGESKSNKSKLKKHKKKKKSDHRSNGGNPTLPRATIFKSKYFWFSCLGICTLAGTLLWYQKEIHNYFNPKPFYYRFYTSPF